MRSWVSFWGRWVLISSQPGQPILASYPRILAAFLAHELEGLGGGVAWHRDGDGEDGFQEDGLAVGQPLLEGECRRHLEGELVAVHGVELAVGEGDADIDHGEAERSLGHEVAGTGLDRRDVLLGHRTADDAVVEGEAFAPGQRADVDLDVAELAVAAALLLVTAVCALALRRMVSR